MACLQAYLVKWSLAQWLKGSHVWSVMQCVAMSFFLRWTESHPVFIVLRNYNVILKSWRVVSSSLDPRPQKMRQTQGTLQLQDYLNWMGGKCLILSLFTVCFTTFLVLFCFYRQTFIMLLFQSLKSKPWYLKQLAVNAARMAQLLLKDFGTHYGTWCFY